MDAEYYAEYFKKYSDSSEEDAVKVQRGITEMSIMESISDDPNDKVAHQAAIVLGFNFYRNDKDGYAQEICYDACTAECEIQKVIDRCKCLIHHEDSDGLEDDVSTLTRLITETGKQVDSDSLGYISDDMQRAFLICERPDYDNLSSNIDYILYDLLDVLDLYTEESRQYVYKHRENFIRPIMNLVLSSGDIMLMEQMKQVYTNWMEWR